MAHSENNTLSSVFKTFFERETLTSPNSNEWYRSLRIVLRVADTFDYLYKPCPNQHADTATEAEKVAFRAEYKKHSDVACIMLGKMSPALQRQLENYPPQNMLAELRKMFEKPPAVEIYDLVDALHSCRQAPGKPVSKHVMEMKGLMDQLHTLGKPYDNNMAINLINRSLNKDFGDFVRNFNMHYVGKTVTELHALLIDFEKGLKGKAPTPQIRRSLSPVLQFQPCPDQPVDTATAAEKAAFRAEYKKHSDVACIMLGKMSPALQKQFENYPPQNMLAELRKTFEKPPAVEIYDLVDALHSCR
uniref:Zinc finger, CCHC-type n=1 Tax=Tanacetum cinerariifolium TaxID=118510 RepID=A0A699KZW6_TANCI|nr:hypothetical protein [Tanacetum cinerariifolium]